MSIQPYNLKRFPFMGRRGPQQHITEAYVTCPPALAIQDNEGAVWTIGFVKNGCRTGEFEHDVVRNGQPTGEFACRIEFRRGRVRIFGANDRLGKVWNGRTFV